MTEAEFTALYQQYAPRLLRSARSILARYGIPESQLSAEDVASIVWAEAWRHSTTGGKANYTWLKMRSRDRVRDWIGARSCQPVCVSYGKDDPSHEADEDAGSWLDKVEFRAYWSQSAPAYALIDGPSVKLAMESLPENYQEVLFFRFEGFTSQDIAEYYGIKLHDAKMLTNRAISRLRSKLST